MNKKLPRDHFSWSQLNLWMRNKYQYRERYYVPEAVKIETKETLFGKKIAGIFEGRNFKDFPILADVVAGYEVSEHPLSVEIGGVRVVGYLDLYNREKRSFKEIKTGHTQKNGSAPWDRAKVAAHDQLVLYSMLIREMEGDVDPWCELVWIETAFKEKKEIFDGIELIGGVPELELTGKIEGFRRRVARWEHKRIKKLIGTVTDEIAEDYASYLLSYKSIKS